MSLFSVLPFMVSKDEYTKPPLNRHNLRNGFGPSSRKLVLKPICRKTVQDRNIRFITAE